MARSNEYRTYCQLLWSFHKYIRFGWEESAEAVRDKMSACAGQMTWEELKLANRLSADLWAAASEEEMSHAVEKYLAR